MRHALILTVLVAVVCAMLPAGTVLAGDPVGEPVIVRPVRPDVRVSPPTSQPSPMERIARPGGATTKPDFPMSPLPPGLVGPRPPATRPDTTAKRPIEERAPLRLKLGFYDQAEDDFKQLLTGEKTRLSAAVGLAEVYRRTGRYDQAGKVLADVASVGEKTTAWRCEKVELLATIGQYAEAQKLAEAALTDEPTSYRARWLAGQTLEAIGRSDDARDVYKPVDAMTATTKPDDPAERTFAGLSLDRYSRLIGKPVAYGTRVMQDFFQDAYQKLDMSYWPAQVAAGNLFMSAYKTEEAAKVYNEALKTNPKAYEANIGLGVVLLEMYRFEQVDQQIVLCEKTNPKDPSVMALRAALRLQERNWPAATTQAEAGLAVNPNHLELMGLLAAAKLRVGQKDAFDTLLKRAEAVNPRPADFYSTVAEWQAAARQFASAEGYFLKAIELAPWNANPMTSLGMMYMQTGSEDKASKILDKAFAIDRYNNRSKMTLDLLDQIRAFDVLTSEHFIVKFNRTNDAILGPYWRDYMESIYAELSRDYEINLPQKTTIEVFPKHDQFSVRVSGKSWIPTVGACTGWVIAMYSPRDMVGKKNPQTGEPMGYNWARVLRHEFTHVVTLAATENRIPHWFTEGLAVNQEDSGGPPQWRWVNLLSTALRTNQLFAINQLDWGFIRPKQPADREKAYAQSEWVVQFIVDQYGYSKLNEMIKGFLAYKTQPQVIQDVIGLSEAEFDKLFRQWAADYAAREWKVPVQKILPLPEAQKAAKDKPQDAATQANLAMSYAAMRNVKESEKAARAALAIDPKQPLALEVLGQLLEKTKWDEAKGYLVTLADVNPDNAVAARILAQHALRDDQRDMAIFWFNRLKAASPHDPLSYTGLAGIYLDMKAADKAIPELVELARRQTTDPACALRLAELFIQVDKPDQALVWLTEATHFDPFNPTTHERMAKAYIATKDLDKAVEELKMAIQLKPDEAAYWARLAYLYHDLGKKDLALKAARFAVKLNPESNAKDLLEGQPGVPAPTPRGAPQTQPEPIKEPVF